MKLFNTLSRKLEEFKPINPPKVGMYTCGQTVYDYTHIGHLRRYVGDDILRRVLKASGFEVKHVQNVTDVGHLTSDADYGDDKLEKGARDRNMSVWEVARFFEDYHYKSLDQLNVLRPHIIARATEHINEQIKLIEKLEKNGFIYKTDQAIYFDISKFPNYTKFSGQKLEEKESGRREDVVTDSQKRNPQDFALWFFTVGHFVEHTMKWSTPWGEGFPGWHIECSAMSMEYLGDTIDIHTGGIDHIPIHHTNEIAQSEGATGKQFVRYWVHNGWLLVEGEKMSKSKKNYFTVDDVKAKGFDPIALRYLFLTANYKDMQNFTWEALSGARNTLNKIRQDLRGWSLENGLSEQPKDDVGQFWQRFLEAASHDINMPQALAVMHEMLKSSVPTYQKAGLLLKMDVILGLGLDQYLGKSPEAPADVIKLVEKREMVRKSGDYKKSDEIRKEISSLGFEVEDTSDGSRIKKNV